MFSLYGCAGMMGGNTAASGDAAAQTGGSWWIIFVYIAIFAALYFILIRPNSKKKKEEQQMRENITIGDDVTTIGGIVGRVVAVKEEEDAFIIETGSDRVKMKFKKWAISTVDTKKDTPAATEEKGGFFSRFKKKNTDDNTSETK